MNNIVTKSGKMLFTLSECKAYIDTLEKKLSDKPPADKETVKHGRWIPQGDGMSGVLYEDPYYGLIREMSGEALESNILDLFEEKDRLNVTINKLEKEKAELRKVVKRGKWDQGKCTNCQKSLEDLFSGDFYWNDDDLHYCPNCGARMDGG